MPSWRAASLRLPRRRARHRRSGHARRRPSSPQAATVLAMKAEPGPRQQRKIQSRPRGETARPRARWRSAILALCRPVVRRQARQERVRQIQRRDSQSLSGSVREKWRASTGTSSGRSRSGGCASVHHGLSPVQISRKRAARNFGFQIAVAAAQHAHVHVARPSRHAPDLALLQRPQKLPCSGSASSLTSSSSTGPRRPLRTNRRVIARRR